jgi:hypothetical protein
MNKKLTIRSSPSSAVKPWLTAQISFEDCGEEFHWLAGEASLTALGSGKPPKPGSGLRFAPIDPLIPFVVECRSRTVEIRKRLLR